MLPKILIIVLNRGRNDIDFIEEFDIPEYLDFTKKNIVIDPNSYMKYYLISFIKLLGDSRESGHFIAYVRNGKSNLFNCYNDVNVSKCNINDALRAKISEEDKKNHSIYFILPLL